MLIPLATAVRPDVRSLLGRRSGHTVTDPRVLASYGSPSAPRSWRRCVNTVFGTARGLGAGALRFPGKRLVDAVVDLPFALPTAVAGIALTALYAPNGWIGPVSRAAGHQGRVYAAGRHGGADLHRPALRGAHGPARAEDLELEVEEAAASLGRDPLADVRPGRASRPWCRPC